MREYSDAERNLIKAEARASEVADRLSALIDAVSECARAAVALGGEDRSEIENAMREAEYYLGTADTLVARIVKAAAARRAAAAPPAPVKASRRKVAA